LLAPENESLNVPVQPEFLWEEAIRATSYELQVSSSADFGAGELVKERDGIEQLSYQSDQALDWNQEFFWRVRGNNDGVVGAWSDPFRFQTQIEPPPAVVLLSPENEEADVVLQPMLTWSGADRAETYQLQLSVDTDFTSLLMDEQHLEAVTFEFEEELNPNETYFWRVRAENESGTGPWSDQWSFTTIPMPPGRVDLVSPVDSAGSVSRMPVYSWEEAERAHFYEVQVAVDAGFNALVEATEEVSATTFEALFELEYYQGYYWRVRAHNTGGTGEWSETGTFVTIAETPITRFPVDGSVDISTSPTLSWFSLHDETRFEIEVTPDEGGILELESLDSQIMIQGLAQNSSYIWRVRLHDDITSSNWSSEASFSTRPDPVRPEVEITVLFHRPGEDPEGQVLSEKDYKLFGMPGDDGFAFDRFFAGQYSDDWRVFRDIGGETDYYQEYDPDANPFVLSPGEGYWVLSRGSVDFQSEITPVIPNEEDVFLIPLNPGWNIISNPFEQDIFWMDVLELNTIETDLFGYDQVYETSDVLIPGVGYYFFNDPAWQMNILAIPYTPVERRTESSQKEIQKQLAERRSKEARLALSGTFVRRNDYRLTTRSIIEYHRDAMEGRHPGMEMVRYGMAFLSDDEAVGRTGLYHRIMDSFDDTGSEYSLMVKAPVGEKLIWEADMSGLGTDAAVLLINPVTHQSYLLSDHESVETVVSEPLVTWSVFTGRRDYLKEIQDQLLPEEISLLPNYPNPFNPMTNIRYALTQDSDVRLEVFDVLGRRVQVLVSGHQSKGWHVAQFDGSQLSSGVYIYRLMAGDTQLTRKMMLIK
ncbi:T9SS type A sorting domain-containing protein, partial [Balneolaceae bacterium ANBcel3]|nr:T9SS type A sorting domain-containing protein [Balneolaceae bacterium ANBcel3]